MSDVASKDRVRGALLGLAIGDALGAAIEFRPPGTFDPVTGMRGGGPWGLEAGYWTDDTSMALCLAESLIECGGFAPVDQLQRYVRWSRDGHLSSTGECFDIGNATASALRRFERTGDAYCGSTDHAASGNGSLMRLAPAPLFFARDPAQAIAISGESSRTTHASAACVDACRYYGGLIASAAGGIAKEDLLSPGFSPTADEWANNTLHAEIAAVMEGSFREKEPPAIRGSGYVVESMEAALWAFAKSNSFADGCLLAVNLGDDADTTGAIYGQLAGAYYGMHGLPQEWLSQLAHVDLIIDYADRLYAASLT